jgi:glutathione peroxidase-family protein
MLQVIYTTKVQNNMNKMKHTSSLRDFKKNASTLNYSESTEIFAVDTASSCALTVSLMDFFGLENVTQSKAK